MSLLLLFGGAGTTLTLVPVSASANQGATHEVLATLLENGAPLVGRTLNWTITGANPDSGTEVTDANGEAIISWVGTNTGTDTLTVDNAEPQRFYFSGNTSDITPTESSEWELTSGNPRLQLVTASDGSVMGSVSRASSTTEPPRDYNITQFVSAGVLSAQSITGTVKGMMRLQEESTNADMRTQVSIRVLSGDGTVERGTLVAHDTAGTLANEWPTTLESRKIPGGWTGEGATLTPVTCQSGDRLVVEVGFRRFDGSGSTYSGTLRYGAPNGAQDLGETEGETNDYRPWLEFSHLSGDEYVEETATVSWAVIGGGTFGRVSGRVIP